MTRFIEHDEHETCERRLDIVTAARKKGFVKAPTIIIKPPVVSTTATDISNVHLICIVLFLKSFVKLVEGDTKIKEFNLNYIGESRNRHYAFKRINLYEILIVTYLKHKIDVKKLYIESSKPSGK